MTVRLLVLDAYDPAGRAALRDAGCTEAGPLYVRMLQAVAPDARVEVAHPADSDREIPGSLSDYDGFCWTGSSLTVHREGDARVRRQVDLVRAAFRAGVPQFGSCFALQLATVAAGGSCGPSPRGREFGVSRGIALTAAGAVHPLFAGKPAEFSSFTSHQDEVQSLPANARLLARNAWSEVQSAAIAFEAGEFWAVQYHPEYDLREVARLTALRVDELVGQGHFASGEAAAAWQSAAELLHGDPELSEIAAQLGVDAALFDPAWRAREVGNWLDTQVRR